MLPMPSEPSAEPLAAPELEPPPSNAACLGRLAIVDDVAFLEEDPFRATARHGGVWRSRN